MQKPSIQTPSSVVMIRPHHFSVNTETGDNVFQAKLTEGVDVSKRAFDEFTGSVKILRLHGVHVHVFEGENEHTPDCVFPNNWFSTHAGGHVAIYPMKAPNRRLERRVDVIEMLKHEYRVQDVIDYSGLEQDKLYLEGTGAMVIDHIERVAYAVESDRTSPILLERFCTHFNYEPMAFSATDEAGVAVYHTNVLMCIGTEFALIGSDMITDNKRRQEVVDRLAEPGREVVQLNNEQIAGFAGNAIELQGSESRILALSQTALDVLSPGQKAIIEQSAKLVPLPIPTIEFGGGSVRCTIAGIHLSRRIG